MEAGSKRAGTDELNLENQVGGQIVKCQVYTVHGLRFFFVMEVSSKDFSVHECHNQVVFKVGLVTFGGWFEKG